jgi:hypothetical protein
MKRFLFALLLALPLSVAVAGVAGAQSCNPAHTAFCLIEPTAASGDDVAPYCFLPTLTRGQYETNYAVLEPGPPDCHTFETFMRFILPSNLLDPGETVTSATLLIPYLFSFAFEGPVVPPPHAPVSLRLHRVTSFWNENAVTWVNKPPYEATPIATVTGITNYGVREFNVTTLVRDWAAGVRPNYGFALTTPNNRVMGFNSWESSAPAAQKPALLIVVGPGTPPTPVPIMPAWVAILLVIGFATVLAIRLPRRGEG